MATKLMIRRIVHCNGHVSDQIGLKSSLLISVTTYRRLVTVVLIVTVCAQAILLVVAGMTWDTLVGVDGLNVSSDLFLLEVDLLNITRMGRIAR